MRYESEIFTIDRPLRDLSLIKISAFYIVSLGQESPLKDEFLIKMEVFRIGYLRRNGLPGKLIFRSWQYSL
jgi:hypothetical protein